MTPEDLSAESSAQSEAARERRRDLSRAIVRLIQELEAIDWYHAPIGVVAIDAQGHVLAWNGSAGEILNVREWEVLGTPLLHLFSESSRPGLERLIARCITTDQKCAPEVFERLDQKGAIQHVEVTAASIRSRAGEHGATVLLQDVTERVVAEAERAEAERRFRTLVQGLDAIVWEADPGTLEFTFVSQRAETILGYAIDEWLTEPDFWAKHIHPDDRHRAVAYARACTAEGRDHEHEYRMLAADGRAVWLRDQVTVVRDDTGRVSRLFGIMLDITERKRTEQSLARLYTRAEDDVQRKDELLATLAHELRTPLGAIVSALEVMQRRGRLDDQALAAHAMSVRQARHLTRLTEELLEVSRAGSGKLELTRRPVDLNEIVRDSLQAVETRLGGWRHEVSCRTADGPVLVNGDTVRLEQVVVNLVENAAKFTPERGRIAVTVGRHDHHAVVTVTDTGAGLGADVLHRVFEPFFQAPKTTNAAGGLGLGLTLVRRLVELHGGSVAVHSDGPEHGAEFQVRLPLLSADGPVVVEATPARAPSRLRVLVIDDHEDTRELLRVILEQEGYQVDLAEDGPRGIERARAHAPAAAIVDLGLPGLVGYEVAQQLASRRTGRPYLVAVTGYGEPEDRRRADAAGFDAFLLKPVDAAELVRLLSAALRR